MRIFSYIRTLVPHSSDAEDIYQRVCLTLWNKFTEFDPERSFFSWSCGIAFNIVRNYNRSVRHDRHHFNQELIETMSHKREQHLQNYNLRVEFLQDCLKDLESRDRQLLRSTVFENQSVTEIAQETDKATQTLYNRLSIIRRELAECISRKLQREK